MLRPQNTKECQSGSEVISIGLREWLILLAVTALAFGIGYRWEILFYDGIYYLRTVSEAQWYVPTWSPFDRWTHVNFLWLIVNKLGGPSAFIFHSIQWIYRFLMVISVAIWWRIFTRFWGNKTLKIWGLYFLATCPLIVYGQNQIVPEQWSLLFTGLGSLFILKSVESSRWWLALPAGLLIYVGFLSRSDSLLLPAALFLSSFVWQFYPRKKMLTALALMLVLFLPLLLWHIHKLGLENMAPMLKAIWEYKRGNLESGLKEFWRAAAMAVPMGIIGFFGWRDRGTRVLATASLLIYTLYIGFIASGRTAIGRHTLQGVLVLTALGTIGFSIGVSWFSRWFKRSWVIAAVMAILIPFHVWAANRATAGVDLNQAKRIFEKIRENYPGSLLCVADDPTFYFYRFYYPRAERPHLHLVFDGGDLSLRDYYHKELDRQLGAEYLTGIEELKSLRFSSVIYVGDMAHSWMGNDPALKFEPLTEFKKYKGQHVMEGAYLSSLHSSR